MTSIKKRLIKRGIHFLTLPQIYDNKYIAVVEVVGPLTICLLMLPCWI